MAGWIDLRIDGRVCFIKKRNAFLQTVDLIAPYIALGQAIGRLGCFLNGCCYGKEVAWGIFFLFMLRPYTQRSYIRLRVFLRYSLFLNILKKRILP